MMNVQILHWLSFKHAIVFPHLACGWGVGLKAGTVRVWVAGKLCDPLVTHGLHLSALKTKGL